MSKPAAEEVQRKSMLNFGVTELRDDTGRYLITRTATGDWECWCSDAGGQVLDIVESQEAACAACQQHADTTEEFVTHRDIKRPRVEA